MNTRDHKLFAPGYYYHVYNRGNAKDLVFRDEEDYRFFLYRLKENIHGRHVGEQGRYVRRVLPTGAFTLVAYCLMPNHFHFLIRQNTSVSISELFLRLSTGYSKYFNKKYNRVGHVFQDQFKAILVADDAYLVWLAAYIHTNPVVAQIVSNPEEYTWSSYQDCIGIRSGVLCDASIVLNQVGSVGAYKNFIAQSVPIIRTRHELKSYFLD